MAECNPRTATMRTRAIGMPYQASSGSWCKKFIVRSAPCEGRGRPPFQLPAAPLRNRLRLWRRWVWQPWQGFWSKGRHQLQNGHGEDETGKDHEAKLPPFEAPE